MIRNKIAKFAKETENRISSFKINRKICIILTVIITLTSIGFTTNRLDSSSNTVLALSETTPLENAAVLPTTKTSASAVFELNYNKNSFCKVLVVKHGGEPQLALVREGTVRKALEATHTELGSNDVLNCELSDKVYDGMKIVIKEVIYKHESSSEKITLEEFKKAYPNESAASLSVYGKVLVNKTVTVKYVNGKKKSETVKSLSYKAVDVVEPTTPKYYGKEEDGKISKTSKKGAIFYSQLNAISELSPSKDFKLDKNGIPVNYSKKITGTASAYSCGTHTATGKAVRPGYIAVNPKQIPYGTKMFIRSSDGNYIYGYASAEDTGGFVAWGNTLADLFFWSESDCVNFGRRSIEIYILN